MMKKHLLIPYGFLSLFLLAGVLSAQVDQLHGDENYSYSGLHSGNQIKASFYNDGLVGKRYINVEDIGGEWPINSGHVYINQLIMFVQAEVKDIYGNVIQITSEGNGCTAGNSNNADSGDSGPNGEWYSMAPIPGFANPAPPSGLSSQPRIAMSHWDWSWPEIWPDKTDDAVNPGWPGSWNGYFGKDIMNADQESYYLCDDYNNREFAFYPDSTDSLRRGLGLRATVRGFQWSNVLVEDVLFCLYDIKNIGTAHHDKMNFGIMSGPVMGNRAVNGGDGSDDGGEYNLEEELGYHLDQDDIGAGGWTPVGFHGLAFFESPGNPYDGIDNDGDGVNGSGKLISEDMFAPKTFQTGDPVVVVDYTTFARTVTPMPEAGVTVVYQKRAYTFLPGQELVEVENNLIDDNLNGIIDESNGSVFGEGTEAIQRYLYLGLKYIDYRSGEGKDNPLIDEKRDDGLDNDGNWSPLFDDVGLDGAPNTGDFGEGDGLPTSGRGTNLPGEPHIDKTDIHESDMIGLTAFNIYTPWTLYPINADDKLWEGIKPGFLNAVGDFGDTDIMLGSGYFPMVPDQIERFSLGILFGSTQDDLFRNKGYAQKAYAENYNFSKAPLIPTLTAIPGDNRVILIWDNLAEESIDPITGKDFEGYRIYRSTDPGFTDMVAITDGYGTVAGRKPLKQFDLKDGIQGFANVDVNGVKFYLGDDTGLEHVWIDSTALNGFTYYYAVTSYDLGDAVALAPTECSKYIMITPSGAIDKGKNVAIVRPEAPAAGYLPPGASEIQRLEGGTADGQVACSVIQSSEIREGHVYRITFEDTLTTSRLIPTTKNFTLVDVTAQDTLIKRDTTFHDADDIAAVHGFKLAFRGNPALLGLNTAKTRWNSDRINILAMLPYKYKEDPVRLQSADLKIVFGEVGIDSSTEFNRGGTLIPAMPVNFKVLNASLGDRPMKFCLRERDAAEGEEGRYTSYSGGKKNLKDELILLNDDGVAGWILTMGVSAAGDTVNPVAGDTAYVFMTKPFLAHDTYEFVMQGESFNADKAKGEMDAIKVVPNPYIVSNSWEPLNPYASGRGPRELHFIHLPPRCTIKIFNVRGQLVTILEHQSELWDGTEIWNMMTKDQLDIAYGVYVYHVDAGDLGSRIGKFAVIK